MKSEQKHTPGPWHLGTNGDDCAPQHAICHGPTVIAKVYGRGYPIGKGSSPQSLADARLMAAAPDLLALVNALQDWYDENGGRTGPHAGSLYGPDQTWNDQILYVLRKVQGP